MELPASLGSQQASLRHWKFLSLYESSPWEEHASFLSNKLDQLPHAGDTAETIASEDPVGVLALLGVLCVPITQPVDQEVDDLDALIHQAQQQFSIAILEELAILEEPTLAAQSYVRWAIAAVAETARQSAFDFDALFERPQVSPSSPTCSTGSDADSGCSTVIHVHFGSTVSP